MSNNRNLGRSNLVDADQDYEHRSVSSNISVSQNPPSDYGSVHQQQTHPYDNRRGSSTRPAPAGVNILKSSQIGRSASVEQQPRANTGRDILIRKSKRPMILRVREEFNDALS